MGIVLVGCREGRGEAWAIMGLGVDLCLRAGSVRQVGSRFGEGCGGSGVGGWGRRRLFGGDGLVNRGNGVVLV